MVNLTSNLTTEWLTVWDRENDDAARFASIVRVTPLAPAASQGDYCAIDVQVEPIHLRNSATEFARLVLNGAPQDFRHAAGIHRVRVRRAAGNTTGQAAFTVADVR